MRRRRSLLRALLRRGPAVLSSRAAHGRDLRGTGRSHVVRMSLFLARPSAGPGVATGARAPATARGDRRLQCRRAGPPRASVAPAARRGPASARQRAGFASRSPQGRTLLGEHRVCSRRYQWTTARLSYLSIDAIGRSIPPHATRPVDLEGDHKLLTPCLPASEAYGPSPSHFRSLRARPGAVCDLSAG